MTNKKMGNSFESELCKLLAQHGFWAHNLQQNSAGQPADVIACKNGKSYLIDCKVCTGDKFKLSRIEDNQEMAMTAWRNRGNGVGWFALKFEDDIYMVTHSFFRVASTSSTFTHDEIVHYAIPLDDWLRTKGCRHDNKC